MKAVQLKANLDGLELLSTEDAEAIEAALDPPMVQDIRASTRLAWLPLEYDIALSRAVVDRVGFDESIDWAHRAIEHTLQGPMLRNVVRPALRLFGTTPSAVLKLLPRMMSFIYKDCGEFSVGDEGMHAAAIELRNMPDVLAGDDVYLRGLGESFVVACMLCDMTATVELSRVGPDHVRWVMRWGTGPSDQAV